MDIIAPVVLGLVLAFFIGGTLVHWVLSLVKPRWWSSLADKDKVRIAVVGGGVCALLLGLSIAVGPDWMLLVWIVLPMIALPLALFELVLSKSKGGAQRRAAPGLGVSARVQPVPKSPHTPGRSAGFLPSGREDYYTKLLLKAQGDKGLAGRLIEYERQRDPSASFDELCKVAIERWERDNR